MKRGLRRFFTTVREKSYVSYAKIAASGGLFDSMDFIIMKATAPDDDMVLHDKYVFELLQIFSICSSFRAFALSFSRRFQNTQCWRVALKCLLLIHRLLRSLPDNTHFKAELLLACSNGCLSLYPCLFQNHSVDYTSFIRAYAQLINEALCFGIFSNDHEEEEVLHRTSMEEMGRRLEMLVQLQSLIDRVIDCRPTGPSAPRNFIVRSAMKLIIRDSFVCYIMFRTENVVALENLLEMPYGMCNSALAIYKKAALQANQLSELLEWCKSELGIYGSTYEYPFIERIPEIQIRALQTLLEQMWNYTEEEEEEEEEESSSTSITPSSPILSARDDDDDDGCAFIPCLRSLENDAVIVSEGWESLFEKTTSHQLIKFGEDEEKEPLISKVEEPEEEISEEGVGWETLLEATVNQQIIVPSYSNPYPNHGLCI